MPKNVTYQKKKRNQKILICESRDLSYGSSGFFLRQIRTELEKQDIPVEHFKLQEDLSNLNDLEDYADRSFAAILDINSHLPRMVLEDGTYLLDHIRAPFFNYIVDHPVHLHPLLSSPARNHYILCLDKLHQQYIQTYYPNISGCFVMPLAGSVPQICKPYPERSRHIYFPGTYVPLVEYEAKLRMLDETLISMTEEYDRKLQAGETVPDLITWFRIQQGKNAPSPQQLHTRCRYMDRYLREMMRHRVLEAVLSEGYCIHVTGVHWEYYDGKYDDQLIMQPACDYETMLSQIGDSQIVLNVQPLFPNAAHDRVLCGMAGGAVVLTDACSFLEENFIAGQHYLRYESHSPKHSIHKLRRYLHNTETLCNIAEEGRQSVREAYLWSHWTRRFLQLLESQK